MSAASRAVRRAVRAAVASGAALACGLAAGPPAQARQPAGAAPAPACASAAHAIDDRGVAVCLARPAQRIVTLLPSLTETVCVLGACGRLAGTDRWSNWPPEVRALPKAGGLDDADLERIVALRPDLVLAGRSTRVVERLESLGIRVAAFEARSLSDVPRVLRAGGALVGAGSAAEQAWQAAEAAIEAAAHALPPAVRGRSVYFEVDSTPYAAGPSSFIGELLARLGARNVVPAALGPFPRLNPEFVVRADPDLIVVPRRQADALAQRPGWSGMRALRPGAAGVCAFDAADFDVLVRPGPRLAQAAGLLAGCLQAVAR